MPALVGVDILQLFFMYVAIGMEAFIMIAFPLAQKHYWYGALGQAEYRNKSGIMGIIASPDGFVGIERLKFHFPGLLESVASKPHFGKYFFAGKDSVLKPVAGIRVAIIMARDALAGSIEAMALTEAMRGDFTSTSDQIDAALESRTDSEARAAGAAGAAAKAEASRKRRGYIFRRGGKAKVEAAAKFEGKNVPVFKNIEEVALFWCETRYFPSRVYQRRVQQLDEAGRLAKQKADPAGYGLWRQAYIDDQVDAHLAKAQLENERSIMVEIKTGVLRKTMNLEGYDLDQKDQLTVIPKFSTIQETKPMDGKARVAWFTDKFAEWAKDTKYWPKDVGGRTLNVGALADFKLANLGQGQINDMLQNERNIMTDEQVGRDEHLLRMVIAVVALIGGIALAFYILTH